MIKVLHILKSNSFSGAENVILTIIRETKNAVESIYACPPGPIEEYLFEEKVQYFPIKTLSISEVRRCFRQCKPDIIHAHDYTAGIICAFTGTKIPIINHLHNNSPWIKHYNLRSFVYGISCIKYKMIFIVSKSIVDEYIYRRRITSKTKEIGNPIDIKSIRSKTVSDEIRWDVVFLGRLSPQKNPHAFIQIVKRIRDVIPNVSAVMIGDGELRQEIESEIQIEGLEKNIILLGFQKNPYMFLNQGKVLCMPSLWEGYGLAAVEALALGKPVVCSNVGGLPSIVNNSCGSICTDMQQYCAEIINLLSDYDYYNQKSISAERRAEMLDNIKPYIKEIVKVYKSVV